MTLPDRSRGVIALREDSCTSCMVCARECPDWCIYIDSHKETAAPAGEGVRPRTHHVLDRFAIDYALCMYCGICIEVCPWDALFWSTEYDHAAGDVLGLTHERETLGVWLRSAPDASSRAGGAR
jgi:NADH-quinone oxidoreductase subunit I